MAQWSALAKYELLRQGLAAADESALSVRDNFALLAKHSTEKLEVREDGAGHTQIRFTHTPDVVKAIMEETQASMFLDLAMCHDAGWKDLDTEAAQRPGFDVGLATTVERLACHFEPLSVPQGVRIAVTGCSMFRDFDKSRVCDEAGNYWTYDIDPSLMSLGFAPGEKLVQVGTLVVDAPGVDPRLLHEVGLSVKAAILLAVDPPSYKPDKVTWTNIYNMGLAVVEFKLLLDACPGDIAVRVLHADGNPLLHIRRSQGRLQIAPAPGLLQHMFIGALLVALGRAAGDASFVMRIPNADGSAFVCLQQEGGIWAARTEDGGAVPNEEFRNDLEVQPHFVCMWDALHVTLQADLGYQAGSTEEEAGYNASKWSKLGSLQLLAIMLSERGAEPAAVQWKVLVIAAAAHELAGNWQGAVQLLHKSRVVDECLGGGGADSVAWPEWGVCQPLLFLATAILQGKQANVDGAVFDPVLVGPWEEGAAFDHEGPGVLQVQRSDKRKFVDGVHVGPGRGVGLFAGKDTLAVRVNGGVRLRITLQGDVLYSNTTFKPSYLFKPLTRLTGLNIMQVVGVTWAEPQSSSGAAAGRVPLSNALFRAFMQGDFGHEPASWLLCRILSGDLPVKSDSMQATFIAGSPHKGRVRLSESSPYSVADVCLAPTLLQRLFTYENGTAVWLDMHNNGKLRCLRKLPVGRLLTVTDIEWAGDSTSFRECSVLGKYMLR